ncbi:MAG: nucleoid-associated protein, YbaB/EbfC family [Deltaproteobacteria bacterium GWA2_38_16]|nr:MAG: nucleoid-associated protein, YbaB/EbfC family [Deltaproteobacteria bacterium GWA2_38_16]OGQ03418.1 MAG: nucleoid-associated protein, YbaB/EbfC family [Deltaproteobacteria bacterium RIFCSPHIGHO2_02_FULL_38_15]HBQ21373.1 YbaB/EbfC family nucleoid-associated protein [Deltaproteobacteria bacterium]
MNKLFGGMGGMLKQAQEFQTKMKKIQEELADKTIEASSGGGMVTVKANGRQEILSVTIDPEVLKQNDKDMLQDLIVAATNEALKQSQDLMQSEIGKLTGGFNIPGLF